MAPTSLTTLPNELLSTIASSLPQHDLAALCLVNTHLAAIATPHLYAKITLHIPVWPQGTTPHRTPMPNFESLLTTLILRPSAAAAVRELSFTADLLDPPGAKINLYTENGVIKNRVMEMVPGEFSLEARVLLWAAIEASGVGDAVQLGRRVVWERDVNAILAWIVTRCVNLRELRIDAEFLCPRGERVEEDLDGGFEEDEEDEEGRAVSDEGWWRDEEGAGCRDRAFMQALEGGTVLGEVKMSGEVAGFEGLERVVVRGGKYGLAQYLGYIVPGIRALEKVCERGGWWFDTEPSLGHLNMDDDSYPAELWPLREWCEFRDTDRVPQKEF